MNRHERRAGEKEVMKLALRIAGETPCETCTACCTAIGVTEIGKPAGTPCVHMVPGGCGIYETRPRSCRTYNCCWKYRLPGLTPEDRPDKTGIVLNLPSEKERVRDAMLAFEAWPGAFDEPVGVALLMRLVQDGYALVLVGPGGKATKAMAPYDHPALQKLSEMTGTPIFVRKQ